MPSLTPEQQLFVSMQGQQMQLPEPVATQEWISQVFGRPLGGRSKLRRANVGRVRDMNRNWIDMVGILNHIFEGGPIPDYIKQKMNENPEWDRHDLLRYLDQLSGGTVK